MQPKQNPTNPEALLLIKMKRERAKAAIDKIVKRFAVVSHEPEPGLEVILEYLTSMVYALELLLKVMANDWETHKAGRMYEKVFGRAHPSSVLMDILQGAILNQKFLYVPADGLLDHVPELEALWDELTAEFYHRNWMMDTTFMHEVVAPDGFMVFLRDNLPRFFRGKTFTSRPRISREQRTQMLRMQIQALQNELVKLEAGEARTEESFTELTQRLQDEYVESIQTAACMIDMNSEIRKGVFSFGTWTMGKVLDGCLG